MAKKKGNKKGMAGSQPKFNAQGLPMLTKRQKKQVQKAKASGGPLAAQAAREKFRTNNAAKWGVAATTPTIGMSETPGSAMSGADFADDRALDQAIQQNVMNSGLQTDAEGNQYIVDVDPVTGKSTIRTVYSAENQQMRDQQRQYGMGLGQMANQSMGWAQQNMQNPYSYSGISPAMSSADMQSERQRIEDELYNRQSRMMEPQFQKEREDFEQMAAERGWTPGSEVYDQQKKNILDQQSQQRQDWASQATAVGLSEMQGQYGLSTSERARQIGEMEKLRYQPFSEAQQFMNAQPGIQMGQFNQFQGAQMNPSMYGQMGLGYAQMAQEPWMQQQKNVLDKDMLQFQYNLANSGGGGGGGEELTPEQKMQQYIQFETMKRDANIGSYYTPQQQKIKDDSGLYQIGGGVLAALPSIVDMF